MANARARHHWSRPLVALLLIAAFGLLLADAVAAQDAEPPTISAFDPAEGALVTRPLEAADGRVTFVASARAADLGAGINQSDASWSLEPAYDSVSDFASYFVLTSLGGPDWLVTLQLTVPDGAYRLTFRVADYDGNTADASVNFTVDASEPTIAVIAPAQTANLTAVVRFDIRDSVSGVDPDSIQVRYRTNCAGVWKNASFQRTALAARVVGEALIPVCAGFYGTNSVQVGAADFAGYMAWSPLWTIIVDAQPPAFVDFDPAAFTTITERTVPIRALVHDNTSGVDTATIFGQVSYNGGITWGNWTAAEVTPGQDIRLEAWASLFVPLPDGAHVGVRWRASDAAGNGPVESQAVFFYVNGPPFLVSVEPAENSVFKQYESVRFTAEFADPDADTVRATYSSDIDGYLGTADGSRRSLTVGVHNLTLTADDGHGHAVRYNYTIEVVPRPPADPRPLLVPLIVIASAALAAWWALSPEARRREDDDKF
jgi:hypothetical protein